MISVYKSNYSSFAQIHNDAIIAFCREPNRKKLSINNLNSSVVANFGTIITSFSELLLATPQQIFLLKNAYDMKNVAERAAIKKELGMIGMYTRFTDKNCEFEYNGNQYNSIYLANNIDIKTCPYCNENTTYSFKYKAKNSYRRTFDWDHIVPKRKYPFLAISFFNLVPACKVCNQLKQEELVLVNPHSNFNPDLTYRFVVKGKHVGFVDDSSKIDLVLKVKRGAGGSALINIIDKVGLDARIPTQVDLVRDILNKKVLYKSVYWSGLENFVSINSKKKINLLNLFFGVQFNHEDYYKRPYSKLTSDIIKK